MAHILNIWVVNLFKPAVVLCQLSRQYERSTAPTTLAPTGIPGQDQASVPRRPKIALVLGIVNKDCPLFEARHAA